MAFNFLYIAHSRFVNVPASSKNCNFLRFCELNDIEVFQTTSAYEGLRWLRNNKADIIVVCLPTNDVVWNSFHMCASAISPNSYFVVVASHEDGLKQDVNWYDQHSFSFDSEERIMKVKESRCNQCVVIKCICALLTNIYSVEDILLSECINFNTWNEIDLDEFIVDLPQMIADVSQGKKSQFLNLKTVVPQTVETDITLSNHEENLTSHHHKALVSELQARNLFLNEVLSQWEGQWDALISMLGIGIRMGIASRALYDHLLMIIAKSEKIKQVPNLPPYILDFVNKNSELSHLALLDINSLYDALHSSSDVSNDTINPSVELINLISDVAKNRNYSLSIERQHDGSEIISGGNYLTIIQKSAIDYTFSGSLLHYNALILNLVLWIESNREVWNQACRRLNSLTDTAINDTNEDLIKVELSVRNGALNICICDSCSLVCPAEFVGDSEAQGKLYSNIMLNWPNMPFSVWGLAYARAVVALYQGKINIANTDEGIVLNLELRDRLDLAYLDSKNMYLEESSLMLGRILFVDDEEKNARDSIYTLRKAGFEVDVCDRADRAMEALELHEFNAMVIDLNLPDKNGQELYQEIVESYPKLAGRAIFVTGYLGTGHFIDSDLRAFFAENHCKYLAKPYFAVELLRCVNEVLSQRITMAAQNLSERVLK